MHASELTRKMAALALAGSLAVGVAACDDDPTGPGHEIDEPASVRLMLDGEEIATATATSSTGSIDVTVDGETGEITVEFLDDEGEVIEYDEDDFHLVVEVDDEEVAGFEQDPEGAFDGVAQGLEEGSTTMRFVLMHGAVGGGHDDFTSAAIDVDVSGEEG